MKSKKNNKPAIAAAITGLCLLPIAINKAVFMLADSTDKNNAPPLNYEWRLGNIRYSVHGSGKPLLLIHDTQIGASSLQWRKNIEVLSQNCKVYALDLLGYGYSDKPRLSYTSYMYATLINDFITNVIGMPTSVCAANDSASFTLAAYVLNESNFRRFVLISPTGANAVNSDEIATKLNRSALELPVVGESKYLLETSYEYMKNYVLDYCIYSKEGGADRLVNDMYHCAHFGGANNRYIFASKSTGYMMSNLPIFLPRLQKPVLVIWGEKNANNPVENMESMRKLHNGGRYVLFEECRLLPHYENADEFNNLVRDFMSNQKR